MTTRKKMYEDFYENKSAYAKKSVLDQVAEITRQITEIDNEIAPLSEKRNALTSEIKDMEYRLSVANQSIKESRSIHPTRREKILMQVNRLKKQINEKSAEKRSVREAIAQKSIERKQLVMDKKDLVDNEIIENVALKPVSDTTPQPFTSDMLAFLLVNALRSLTEEQRAWLCFDLYSRSENTDAIDAQIKNLKTDRVALNL